MEPQKLKEEANKCATRTLKLLIKSLPQLQELPIGSRLDTLMKLLVDSLPKCSGSPALNEAFGDILSRINLRDICSPPETEGENLPPVFFKSKRTVEDTSAYKRELNRNKILKQLRTEVENIEANFVKREKYIQQREAQMNREILMWFLEMRINKRSMIGESDLSKINHELSVKLSYFVNDLSLRGKHLHEIMDEVMRMSIQLKTLIERKRVFATEYRFKNTHRAKGRGGLRVDAPASPGCLPAVFGRETVVADVGGQHKQVPGRLAIGRRVESVVVGLVGRPLLTCK